MKADDTTSPAYVAEASGPFVYAGMRGKAMPMPYWRVPEGLLDEPEEFTEWARKAFAVAERTQKPKKTGRKRKA
jgi:DNA transformation protein